ncbi:hypothetical protein OG875_23205 [Streptomyces sp. NBC_01498]|uniref:hypothetical protein n=1 Tax=Streptomyces sp. NBC_01498 TaxID=2975870 RepID=UPI002E7AF284|nr:hypothetical protein [Streptomyces sp. NBC_01498]WTL27215.1 hypothetical protein OG875_23205 [Streptomyces sp. NBC_01498]
MTDARSPMRASRAAILAAVCVTLAAVGHSSMSAHETPPGVPLVAFVVVAALAWLAAGRRRGIRFIGPAVLTAQAALHVTFSAAGAHGAGAGRSHGHAMTTTGAATGEDPVSGGLGDALLTAAADTSPGMLAAHLLAGAVCALWLARGEAAFFRLAETVAAFAFTPLRVLLAGARPLAVPPPPVRARHRTRAPHPPRGTLLAHAVSRRGPPAWCALPMLTTASGAAATV